MAINIWDKKELVTSHEFEKLTFKTNNFYERVTTLIQDDSLQELSLGLV